MPEPPRPKKPMPRNRVWIQFGVEVDPPIHVRFRCWRRGCIPDPERPEKCDVCLRTMETQ